MLKRRKPEYRKGLCQLAATLAWLALVPVAASAAPGDVLFDNQNPMPTAYDFFGLEISVANDMIFVMRQANLDIEPGRKGAIHIYNGAYGTPGFGLSVLSILDPSDSVGDGLAGGLATDDRVIAVGSIIDDTGGTSSGAVWLLDGDSGGGAFGISLTKIDHPEPQSLARFGLELAISNRQLAVGASYQDIAGFENAGAVWLYDVDRASPGFGSILNTIYNPTPDEDDYFGETLAFIGKNLLVGAWGDSTEVNEGGSVYLYDSDQESATFGQLIHRFPNPEPSAGDVFGFAAAAVDSVVAISACSDDFGLQDSGSVYLFDGDMQSGSFGQLLATIRNPFPEIGERFGSALAPAAGQRLIIGSIYDNNVWSLAGSAYLYGANPESPEFEQLLLTVNNPQPNFEPIDEQFGAAVAGLGDHMLIGQPGEGSMFFGYQGRAWVIEAPPIPTLPPPTATPQAASPTPTPSVTATFTPTATPAPCCPGDADNSGGSVNANDFLSVQANFGADNGMGGIGDADCSGGAVNAADFLAVQMNFGANCG